MRPSIRSGELLGYKPSGSNMGLVGAGSADTGANALSRGLMRPAARSGELSGYKPSGSKIGMVGAGSADADASAFNAFFCTVAWLV